MSLEARIAKVVTAGDAAPAWGEGGAEGFSDGGWSSADDELRYADGDEEEEEVVEMDEAEVMALLDADTAPLLVCQRLFRHPPPQALQLLPAAAAERLRSDGWVVLPSFLSAAESAAARAEALAMHSGGAFGAAAAAAPADTNARGDEMLWLHGPPAGAPGLASALARLHALRSDLAQLLSLASDAAATELQLAVYRPGGASYARHRDAFPEDTAPEGRPGQRRVTAVLYANDAAWDCAAQGGALRLHVPPTPLLDDDEQASDAAGGLIPGAAWVDVAPRGGTLALFLSGAVDHEVLPSSEEHRVALTAWFR